MRIVSMQLPGGLEGFHPVNIPVEVTAEEASVISTLLGHDICSSRVRQVYMDILDRLFSPITLFTLSKKIRVDKGCIVVLSIPQSVLDVLSMARPGQPTENIREFIEDMLTKITYYTYKIIFGENKSDTGNKRSKAVKALESLISKLETPHNRQLVQTNLLEVTDKGDRIEVHVKHPTCRGGKGVWVVEKTCEKLRLLSIPEVIVVNACGSYDAELAQLIGDELRRYPVREVINNILQASRC